MSGACGMYFGEEKCIQIFNLEACRAYRLEDLDLDVRMILKWILKK
jgi:hypothetical protein